jgi:hypothetical protein
MRVAVLASALPAALGVQHVGFAAATALAVGSQVAVSAASLVVSAIVLGLALRTVSPRRMIRHAREAAAGLRSPEAAPSVTNP